MTTESRILAGKDWDVLHYGIETGMTPREPHPHPDDIILVHYCGRDYRLRRSTVQFCSNCHPNTPGHYDFRVTYGEYLRRIWFEIK